MKAGYVLLDGCGDRPNPSLNYTTPLEAAYTPNLDTISRASKLGRVQTVRKGVAPESDIAVFNMLGYSFGESYPGRGVVEAVGAGVGMRDGDLALRANLASVDGRAILDRRAGRNLTQEEAERLAEDVSSVTLKGATFEFRATVGYRGVLVIRGDNPLSASITNTDPAYQRVGGFGAAREIKGKESVATSMPESSSIASNRAAELVNEFSEKSAKVLARSKVNKERLRDGKLPANYILLRDAGDHLPKLVPFDKKYGSKGIALVEMPAEVGIAKLLGMRTVPLADRNDNEGKATVFARELREGSVVYVHIKGPDEFGHDGDAVGKKKCIEAIDRDFFSELAGRVGDTAIGVSCDHATPCTIKMHASDPVPLLIARGGKGDGRRFTENNAKRGSVGFLQGRDVLSKIVL